MLRMIYSILFFTLLFYWPSIYAKEDLISSSSNLSFTKKDIRFVSAGDWGCNPMAQRTVNLIKDKNPSLVLALGDFSYEKDTGCWFKIMSPLINKTKIVIGEHDFDTNNNSRLQDYVNKFNLSDPYYSFNYRNIHFPAMSSVIPFSNESLPFKLLQDDSK